jgi:hypothetical protein
MLENFTAELREEPIRAEYLRTHDGAERLTD